MKNLVLSSAAILSAFIAACDSPIHPSAPQSATVQHSGDQITENVIERFTVDLTLNGSFEPGKPIDANLGIESSFANSHVLLTAVLPEMEAYRLANGDHRRIPTRQRLTSAFTWTGTIGRALTSKTTSIVFPQPGYYRIVVTASSPNAPLAVDGLRVQNTSVREAWIWVAEHGGRVTEGFDRSLFGPNDIAAPGVLRSKNTLSHQVAQMNSPLDHQTMSGCTEGSLTYYNSDAAEYQGVPDAELRGWIIDKYLGSQPVTTRTDGNGYYYVCHDGSPSAWVDLYAYLENPNIAVKDTAHVAHVVGSVYADAQVTNNSKAHVYKALVETVTGAISAFGSVPMFQVKVFVGNGVPGDAGYNLAADSIHLPSGTYVWGAYGAYVIPHEYGHFVQDSGPNGWPIQDAGSGGITNPHQIWSHHNLFNGLTEGFADYFAVVTRPAATPGYLSEFENNLLAYGQDGGIIEGAVAAFLLDMGDAIGAGSDSRDIVSYGHQYVWGIVRGCLPNSSYHTSQNPNYRVANGIDEIIYCFEGGMYTAVRESTVWFLQRSPDAYVANISPAVSTPSGWNYLDIRSVWGWNLYKDRS